MFSQTFFHQAGGTKSFKPVDGVSTPCASDKPACTFEVRASHPDTSTSSSQCAEICTTDVHCMYFNFKSDVGLCELYDGTPKNCSQQPNCMLFGVSVDCIFYLITWGYFMPTVCRVDHCAALIYAKAI